MICIVKNSHCFRKQPGCSTVLRLLKCSRCNTFSGKGNAQCCTDISLYKSQNLCTDIQMLVYSQTILRAQCDIPRATWQNETQHSETPELLSVIFKVCALCVCVGGRWILQGHLISHFRNWLQKAKIGHVFRSWLPQARSTKHSMDDCKNDIKMTFKWWQCHFIYDACPTWKNVKNVTCEACLSLAVIGGSKVARSVFHSPPGPQRSEQTWLHILESVIISS